MITITVENDRVQELRFQNLINNISDFTPVWPNIQAYMIAVIAMQFNQLPRGGNARSVYWPDFAIQYVRKDGTIVPAEGIPGEVQGRKRDNTENRVTAESDLMRNTGKMFAGILQKIKFSKTILEMDSAGNYGQLVYQENLRAFQFFEDPTDVEIINQMLERHILKDES